MNFINFDKTELINLKYSLKREILRTNRAGSYSLTTIVGCNTRKYHGLLVCPVDEIDGERHVLLSSLDETIVVDDKEFRLGIHKYSDEYYEPRGHKYIRDFYVNEVVGTLYRIGSAILRKESVMVDGEEQILLKYTLEESAEPICFRFQPFMAFRNSHALSKENLYVNTKVEHIPNGIKARMYDHYPQLHIQFSKRVEFVQVPDWYRNIEYLKEMKRGYDYREDLYVPGYFELTVKPGESFFISASTFQDKTSELKTKFTQIANQRVVRESFKDSLVNAAEQFIVRKNGKTDVIAGYPWFGSWGRDTFIALPGLTLAIGDVETCRDVMDTMVQKEKNGLFPNCGTDENPSYNSVDAPMWFFRALQEMEKADPATHIWKKYGSTIKNILNNYRDGSSFNIRMHDNGLIYAGEEGKALTWMDAIVHGRPITPRRGYDVEINAMWYNAVVYSLELARKAKDTVFVSQWKEMPEKIAGSFLYYFWDERKGYLADYVDGDMVDWSVRPNMVIAIALDHSPLSDEMRKSVLDVAERELLTPRGLRTLSPRHPMYEGFYRGGQEQRDSAYHQGTVWPWLFEFFAKAYLEIYKQSGVSTIQKILEGFEETVHDYGVGTISEVYDGSPPHKPGGAISQAWSVAALLNVMQMLKKFDHNNM